MASILSEMTGPKPPREADTALSPRSRLLMPRASQGETLAAKLLVTQQTEPTEPDAGATDLLLQGLADRLPKPNAVWSLEDRAKWLRTAASIFDLVYKRSEGEQGEVEIIHEKRGAGSGA